MTPYILLILLIFVDIFIFQKIKKKALPALLPTEPETEKRHVPGSSLKDQFTDSLDPEDGGKTKIFKEGDLIEGNYFVCENYNDEESTVHFLFSWRRSR